MAPTSVFILIKAPAQLITANPITAPIRGMRSSRPSGMRTGRQPIPRCRSSMSRSASAATCAAWFARCRGASPWRKCPPRLVRNPGTTGWRGERRRRPGPIHALSARLSLPKNLAEGWITTDNGLRTTDHYCQPPPRFRLLQRLFRGRLPPGYAYATPGKRPLPLPLLPQAPSPKPQV